MWIETVKFFSFISKSHFENWKLYLLLAIYVGLSFQSFASVSVCGCSNWSVKPCNGFDCHVVCFLTRWSVCWSYKKPLFTAQMWQINYIPMIRMARPRTRGYTLGPNLGFSVQSQANLCLGLIRYKHGKLLFLFGSYLTHKTGWLQSPFSISKQPLEEHFK